MHCVVARLFTIATPCYLLRSMLFSQAAFERKEQAYHTRPRRKVSSAHRLFSILCSCGSESEDVAHIEVRVRDNFGSKVARAVFLLAF